MYLRMINRGRSDEQSGRTQGVFQAAFDLLDERRLSEEDQRELGDAIDWFVKNLPGRRAFGRRLPAHAIFWFKAEHADVTRRAWSLLNMLRRHGLFVEMIKTDRPGKIVYQDDMQVAAIPWRQTPA